MNEKELNQMITKLESWVSPDSDPWDWYETTAPRIIERMCKLRGLAEQLVADAVDTATDWGRDAHALRNKEAKP